MFFYEGQSCPVCGQPFQETDDIVACPQCGAPHHRECWKKEGHCHFAAAHGTSEQWKRPERQPGSSEAPASPPAGSPGKTCPHCGKDNPEYAEFCSRCGRELPASDWSSAPLPLPWPGSPALFAARVLWGIRPLSRPCIRCNGRHSHQGGNRGRHGRRTWLRPSE